MSRRRRKPVRQQWRSKRAHVPIQRERPGPLAVLIYALFFIRLLRRWMFGEARSKRRS